VPDQTPLAENELVRLREGPPPNEDLRGFLSVPFTARCYGDAQEVLGRIKEVLEIVLQKSLDSWPSDEDWRSLLPRWFVERCAEERSREEIARSLERWRQLPREEQVRAIEEHVWSVSDWVYGFRPDQRHWYWWDSVVEDPKTFTVVIAVEGWPFAWGTLKWLLRTAGVIAVEEG
jgi:hypothetical protein